MLLHRMKMAMRMMVGVVDVNYIFFLQVCTSLICVTRRVLHPFVIYIYIYILVYVFTWGENIKTKVHVHGVWRWLKYIHMVYGDGWCMYLIIHMNIIGKATSNTHYEIQLLFKQTTNNKTTIYYHICDCMIFEKDI